MSTLPWAKPFLAVMGVPTALVERSQIWVHLATQAVVEYEIRMQKAEGLGGKAYDRVSDETSLLVITQAFRQLANQLGRDVAFEMERWVQRHFLSQEVKSAMFDWELVLCSATYPPNSRGTQVFPPAVLEPLLPEITNLVGINRFNEIEYALKRAQPSLTEEELQITKGEVVLNIVGLTIHRVISQESTIRALRVIALKLNQPERKEVVKWALTQAQAMSATAPEYLRGDKYLQVEAPCFDAPSVQDLPSSDESGLDGRSDNLLKGTRPSLTEQDLQMTEGEMLLNTEGQPIEQVICQESTIKALRALALKLKKQE